MEVKLVKSTQASRLWLPRKEGLIGRIRDVDVDVDGEGGRWTEEVRGPLPRSGGLFV